jgi:hypothetical protein
MDLQLHYCIHVYLCPFIYIYIYIHRVSRETGTKLGDGIPYVKLYRKTPKHLYPKLNGLGDNGN